SFVVIANHWHSHHRLYRHVVRLDRGIMTMNMFWLLLIVITPFATRIITSITCSACRTRTGPTQLAAASPT
ncbi:MAG TPA: TMEM175 family protein, partial [Streptosporangiaceae bacterium]|nr:TMEM175 family protein [Streptosporangiaceae bacterium]